MQHVCAVTLSRMAWSGSMCKGSTLHVYHATWSLLCAGHQHLYIEVQGHAPLLCHLQHVYIVGRRKQVEQECHDGALNLVQHGFDLLHSKHHPALMLAAALSHSWLHELLRIRKGQPRSMSLLGAPRSYADHNMTTCWLRFEVS
jgi:hypothetical protein